MERETVNFQKEHLKYWKAKCTDYMRQINQKICLNKNCVTLLKAQCNISGDMLAYRLSKCQMRLLNLGSECLVWNYSNLLA